MAEPDLNFNRDIASLRNDYGFGELTSTESNFLRAKSNAALQPALSENLALRASLSKQRQADFAFKEGMFELKRRRRDIKKKEDLNREAKNEIPNISNILTKAELDDEKASTTLATLNKLKLENSELYASNDIYRTSMDAALGFLSVRATEQNKKETEKKIKKERKKAKKEAKIKEETDISSMVNLAVNNLPPEQAIEFLKANFEAEGSLGGKRVVPKEAAQLRLLEVTKGLEEDKKTTSRNIARQKASEEIEDQKINLIEALIDRIPEELKKLDEERGSDFAQSLKEYEEIFPELKGFVSGGNDQLRSGALGARLENIRASLLANKIKLLEEKAKGRGAGGLLPD
tara:strand:- start:835 stop:1872 length:1038 start_codon:yes stop_codon:yes gene_type:complete